VLCAQDIYLDFINKQIEHTYAMNDIDVSQDDIKEILSEQKNDYSSILENIMINKNNFINEKVRYQDKIFSLEKIIKINKRAGNTYAVLRDQVEVDFTKILLNQRVMIREILLHIDKSDNKSFKQVIDKAIEHNAINNKGLLDKDYKKYLSSDIETKTIKKLKQNIKKYYAIVDINTDVIEYLYKFESKMFSLNKYSKYHLIGAVVFLNSLSVSNLINDLLEPYGLSVIKILIMLTIIFIIYIIRKFVFTLIKQNINKINFLEEYTEKILPIIIKILDVLAVIININMIIYIYNDFLYIEVISNLFDIIYSFVLTILIYRIVNVIADVKLNSIESANTKVKNEVINVGIKILNFVIFLFGLLIALYFAGVNLTAVLSGLGIGGFAVALAAKDTLANFFGTLSILFSDMFSQGDWIVVDNQEGVVIEIGLRVTTLRTFDNALISIPNGILANKEVKNWDKRSLGRRIKMSVGIKYDSKSQDIKNAVAQIREMLDKHPDIATKNTQHNYTYKKHGVKLVSKDDSLGIKKLLFVHLDEFADSSINILIYCFTKSVRWDDWLSTKEDVLHKIMEILEKNSLEFAFPSLSIYNEK
jgi:MscS family membrane protein